MRFPRILRVLITFAAAVVPRCWAGPLSLRGPSIKSGNNSSSNSGKSSNEYHGELRFEASLKLVNVHSKQDLMLSYGDWVDFEIDFDEAPEHDTRLVVSTVCQQGAEYKFSMTEEVDYQVETNYALHLVDNSSSNDDDDEENEAKAWRTMETSVCQVRLLALYDHFLDVDGVDAFKTHVLDSTLLIIKGDGSDFSDLE